MYLSKGSLVKVIFISSVFLLLGIVFFVAAYFIGRGDISPGPTLTIGIICTAAALISLPVGIYAEGVSKPYSEGLKLLERDMAPDAFIEYYGVISDEERNAVTRPRLDFLELLLSAYYLLEDKKGVKEVLKTMKTSLPPKKQGRVAVRFAEEAYEYGDVGTGDRLLEIAEKKDASATVKALCEDARKSRRARAVRDNECEENYYNGILSASGIFKADRVAAFVAHRRLYELCSAACRDAEATEHLEYCAENGGGVPFAARARAMLKGKK